MKTQFSQVLNDCNIATRNHTSVSELLTELVYSYFSHHLKKRVRQNDNCHESPLRFTHKLLLGWQKSSHKPHSREENVPLQDLQQHLTEALLLEAEPNDDSALKLQKAIKRLKFLELQSHGLKLPLETIVNALVRVRNKAHQLNANHGNKRDYDKTRIGNCGDSSKKEADDSIRSKISYSIPEARQLKKVSKKERTPEGYNSIEQEATLPSKINPLSSITGQSIYKAPYGNRGSSDFHGSDFRQQHLSNFDTLEIQLLGNHLSDAQKKEKRKDRSSSISAVSLSPSENEPSEHRQNSQFHQKYSLNQESIKHLMINDSLLNERQIHPLLNKRQSERDETKYHGAIIQNQKDITTKRKIKFSKNSDDPQERSDEELEQVLHTSNSYESLTPGEISEGLCLPQSILLRDLLYPLQGMNGMYVKYCESLDMFLLRRDVNISTPVRILVSRICCLGKLYRRLRNHLDSHLLPSMSSKKYPLDQIHEWWDDEGVSVTLMPSSATIDPYGSHLPVPTIQSPSSTPPLSPKESSDKHGPINEATVPILSQCQSYPSIYPIEQQPSRSLIYDAFCQFLRDQLTEYYRFLAVLEEELFESPENNRNFEVSSSAFRPSSTLRRLASWLQNPLQRITTLASTTDSVVGLKGGPLLSVIFDLSRRGDVTARTLLSNMLTEITSIWYDMVVNWTSDGVLFDPYDEFCIIQNARCWNNKNDTESIRRLHRIEQPNSRKDSNNQMYSDNQSFNATIPEFLWKFAFTIEVNRVPVFISQATARKILTCGKAEALIKLFEFLESFRLHPSAIYMKSVMRCPTPRTNKMEQHLFLLPNSHHQDHETTSMKLQDVLSDCGNKSDISAINGGSPVVQQRHSKTSGYDRRHGSNTSVSPAVSRLRLGAQQQARWFYPKHIQLLKNLTSAMGVGGDLLVGTILDPSCEFDHKSEPSTTMLHGKTERVANDENKETGTQFVHDLCGRRVPEYGKVLKGQFEKGRDGPRLAEGFKSTKDLENHVNKMEAVKCKKVVDLLLFRYHLLCHCEGIRRILLLGQGDFVQALISQFTPVARPYKIGSPKISFGSVGCDLSQNAKHVLQHQLNICVQSAISSSNAQLFPDEILRRLDIKKLTDGMKKSADSITGLHRVAASVNRIWSDHIRFTRRRLLPLHNKNVCTNDCLILQELDPQSQQAIQQCESLHAEMTDFVRNVQNYLLLEIIETSWIEFLQLSSSLVDKPTLSQQHDDNSLSLVDQLIQLHEDYVESMLRGAFLDGVKLDGTVISEFDVLSKTPIYNQNDNDTRQSIITTLLKLLQLIMDFIELTEIIYSSVYIKDDGLRGSVPFSGLEKLEHLSIQYNDIMIAFLRQLTTIANTVMAPIVVTKNDRDYQHPNTSRYSSARHNDALRALITRLDFNSYYGGEYESYKHRRMPSYRNQIVCMNLDSVREPTPTITRGDDSGGDNDEESRYDDDNSDESDYSEDEVEDDDEEESDSNDEKDSSDDNVNN